VSPRRRHCTPLNVDGHPHRRDIGRAALRSRLFAPPRRRSIEYVMARRRHSPAVTSCNDVIIYNFYSHYTPFQSARQPSEIINTPATFF